MQDYAYLQEAIAPLSKRDAVEHLHHLFPHRTKTWFNRNLHYIMALDPEQLGELLPHRDPTARDAVRNVMASVA